MYCTSSVHMQEFPACLCMQYTCLHALDRLQQWDLHVALLLESKDDKEFGGRVAAQTTAGQDFPRIIGDIPSADQFLSFLKKKGHP